MHTNTNIKYRVQCQIHQLKINKNIDFETKIVWKRHQNKAETSSVKHAHGYSLFNQTLALEFNIPFNQSTRLFEQKKTQFLAIIVYQGRVKSGGSAKYNISNDLNTNPHGTSKVSIPITQCPDPSAFLQVSFSFERLSDEIATQDMSILNMSTRDLQMSRIDFHDDKLAMEMGRINTTLKKFEELSTKLKINQSQNKKPELIKKFEELQGEKILLEKAVQKIRDQKKEKEKKMKEDSKSFRQKNEELQKQLQKTKKQLKQIGAAKMKDDGQNYQSMHETVAREIEDLRNGESNLRKSLAFQFSQNVEEARQSLDLDNTSKHEMEDLSKENSRLQSQVASMSHKLAKLFNASYEYGGAKLLDYLQTSIGLTQND